MDFFVTFIFLKSCSLFNKLLDSGCFHWLRYFLCMKIIGFVIDLNERLKSCKPLMRFSKACEKFMAAYELQDLAWFQNPAESPVFPCISEPESEWVARVPALQSSFKHYVTVPRPRVYPLT